MTKNEAPTYYAQTLPGIEEIAWLEVRERLPGAAFGEYLFAKNQNGLLLFSFDGDKDDLLKLRTTEDVFLLAANQEKMSRGKEDLSRIYKTVAEGESFGRAVNSLLRWRRFSGPPTFRVISRKYGQHQYRRKDFESAVLQGVISRYPHWTPVVDGGQVEIWANMLGSQLIIGLRLSDRSMRHRYDKRVELPASLRPSVAAAMVFLTDPQPEDYFLDPLCGSGTILLERMNAGPYAKILGGDIAGEAVEATRQNLPQRRKGRKQQKIDVRLWDATALPLEDGSISKVAANLPFGKQIAAAQDLEKLYTGIFSEMARVVKPQGRIVLLSSEYDLVKQLMRRQPKLEIMTGYSVAILGTWGRIYLLKRV
jgi:tRNA (guanine6-N2)-methyltransferase